MSFNNSYLLAPQKQFRARKLFDIMPTHVAGDPPSFSSADHPQDQFVFEIDDEGRPVTLTFLCPVDGTGPPTITWSAITHTHTYTHTHTITPQSLI